ncbi:MAG: FHA domain-containing protein [Planctomycetota bacterium]|nr:FHA domain-containing protein [Planctomycetota bacterium]
MEFFRLREALSEEEFLKEYNYPVMVQERATPSEGGESNYSTIYMAKDLLDGKLADGIGQPDRGIVIEIMKRNTQLFEGMINVGRASNNDLVLDVPGISKFHAYFSREPKTDNYSLTDANSKNGTFVNRTPLRPYASSSLGDGDRICFAGQVEFRFYSPAKFYEMLNILIV